MESHVARVRKTENGLLRHIAGSTRVQQIRVFASPVRIRRGRNEVVDMKGRAAVVPLLTMKAINATEHELVAEPIAKAAVVLVTRGTVPSDVRRDWILKSDHETSLSFFGKLENNLFSSSFSTSVRSE